MRHLFGALILIFLVCPASAQDLRWQDANQQSAELFDAEKFEEAAPLARRAAELYPVQSKAYNAENHVQLVWNAVEMTLYAEGRGKAASFAADAIDAVEEKAGEKEILIASLAAEVARMYRNLAEIDKADRFYRQACSLADEVLGETNPQAILYYMNWGHDVRAKYGAAWASGKIKTARERAETHGEDHFLVLRADLLLAKLRLEKGRERTAVRKYQELVDRLEKIEEKDPVLLQASYAHLAYIYAELEEEDALDAIMAKFGESFAGDKERVLPLIRVEPVYPINAARLGQQGAVVVEYTVDELGRVKDAKVTDRLGAEVFDKAALNAVNKWRFRPLLVDGVAQPVAGMQTQLTFKLE